MDDTNKQQQEEKVEETKGSEETQETNETVVKEEFDALKDLASQLENNYKRALADYQNLQRRTQEEKSEWIKMAGKDLVLKFLPVLDTLMLAEKHTKDQNFALTVQQFLQVLQDEGVERIKTVGEEFNPQTMEAVTTQEAEKGEKGKVLEEARAGYMYYNIILRPAQVIVGA